MYNDYMYGVERSNEYLAHYGVKGMKWGIRKALGNVASGIKSARLAGSYARASRKLARLEKRAANGKKYTARAARLGAGAALAGGAAVLGTGGVADLVNRGSKAANAITIRGAKLGQKAGLGLARLGQSTGQAGLIKAGGGLASASRGLEANSRGLNSIATQGRRASNAIKRWGNANNDAVTNASAAVLRKGRGIIESAGKAAGMGGHARAEMARKFADKNALRVSNNTVARIGAAAVGAGLAGAAGYNAYRAATTKRAAKKAAAYRAQMNQRFAGTKYANGAPKRKRRR